VAEQEVQAEIKRRPLNFLPVGLRILDYSKAESRRLAPILTLANHFSHFWAAS